MSVQETTFQDPNAASPPGAAQKVTQAASTTLSTAADASKNVIGEASQQTRAVAGEAKQQAQQLLASTKTELQDQASVRAQQATDRLRSMSSSITALLEGRPEEATQISSYLEQAKSKMDDFAGRLEAGGPQGLVDDLSSFARRRPAAFLMAAGVAGFAMGRLARAGAAASHEGQQPQQLGQYGQYSQYGQYGQLGAVRPDGQFDQYGQPGQGVL